MHVGRGDFPTTVVIDQASMRALRGCERPSVSAEPVAPATTPVSWGETALVFALIAAAATGLVAYFVL